ncbi:hypothetical protein A9Q82_09405 [Cycloclasticus sp. 46_120_T64]|nr:hypothetical protein A9Q82_09405 [Cycloclasticus sp. 46_120_T64]
MSYNNKLGDWPLFLMRLFSFDAVKERIAVFTPYSIAKINIISLEPVESRLGLIYFQVQLAIPSHVYS